MMMYFLIVRFFCTYILSVFRIATSIKTWNVSMLRGEPELPNNATIEDLIRLKVLEVLNIGCLTNTHQPHHSINKWISNTDDVNDLRNQYNFISGTTFWINEHMAVGHAMYDITILEALRTAKVDRIVLQRAPCMNPDLCSGIGTWDSWYQGFYTAALDVFKTYIPIYIRWTWQEKVLQPYYLSINDSSGYWKPEFPDLPIPVQKFTCFERLIRIKCMFCFYPGLSTRTVELFKLSAYKLIKDKRVLNRVEESFLGTGPVRILISYRGESASRHIININHFISTLNSNLKFPQYFVQVINSTNYWRTYEEQMSLVAGSMIVISEHGAFQSNMIYMKRGSLYIDLRGSYKSGEFRGFEWIGMMFGIYYDHVVTKNLTLHSQDSFLIQDDEIESIVNIIYSFVEHKPFLLDGVM